MRKRRKEFRNGSEKSKHIQFQSSSTWRRFDNMHSIFTIFFMNKLLSLMGIKFDLKILDFRFRGGW